MREKRQKGCRGIEELIINELGIGECSKRDGGCPVLGGMEGVVSEAGELE